MKSSTIISLGIIGAIIELLIYVGFIGGGIFFIFWCLKHFGVIVG